MDTFSFPFFFPTGKGYGLIGLRAGHPQGSLDVVPSAAEADRQFFSVRSHVENSRLPLEMGTNLPTVKQKGGGS